MSPPEQVPHLFGYSAVVPGCAVDLSEYVQLVTQSGGPQTAVCGPHFLSPQGISCHWHTVSTAHPDAVQDRV